jgi:hypothetical protein
MQLKAWLFAIARNRSLSVLRARRDHADLEDVQPATEGLAEEVQRRADLQDMLGDLQRLPEDQRAALVLSELGAHSHEEIGVILGVRKDKVKALVFQAREQIAGARAARETPCADIRKQLATLRGGALRRTQLKRHLDECPGCRDFRAEVQRQRAAMALVLPVVPSVGMKASVLTAAFGTAAGGGAVAAGGAAIAGTTASGGGLAALVSKGVATKAAVGLAVAATAGGGAVVVHDVSKNDTKPAPRAAAPARANAAPQSAVQRGIVQGGVSVAAVGGASGSALSGQTPALARLVESIGHPSATGLAHGKHAGGRHLGTKNGSPSASSGHGNAKGHAKDKAQGRALGHRKTAAPAAPAGEARRKAVADSKRSGTSAPGRRTSHGHTRTTTRRTTRGAPPSPKADKPKPAAPPARKVLPPVVVPQLPPVPPVELPDVAGKKK